MFAVIVSGGKQYRVKEGQTIQVEKLNVEEGSSVQFDKVLMLGEGDSAQMGAPFVKNGLVKADVIRHGRGEKIRIIKIKRRKHHMKRMGHRQWFTELKITGIGQ